MNLFILPSPPTPGLNYRFLQYLDKELNSLARPSGPEWSVCSHLISHCTPPNTHTHNAPSTLPSISPSTAQALSSTRHLHMPSPCLDWVSPLVLKTLERRGGLWLFPGLRETWGVAGNAGGEKSPGARVRSWSLCGNHTHESHAAGLPSIPSLSKLDQRRPQIWERP